MLDRRDRALVLAAFQAIDLVVTQISPTYGAAHLDHLGVPPLLRPLLPGVKLAAAVALVATARRPRLRSATGAALLAYYSAATAFHVLASDPSTQAAPAAGCAVLAASLV
jgi:hypothetical protein